MLAFSASSPAWALNLPKTIGDVPKPSAEVRRFELDSITLRDVTFIFDLAVKNPYPVNLPFEGMTLDFAVEGSRVFSVGNKGGFTVPANKEKTGTFKVTLSYEGIIKLVKDYSQHDWLNTVIDGTLVIPLPKIAGLPHDVTFKYNFKKKIPAIKPNVSIQDFKVDPPTPKQIEDAVARAGKKADPGEVLGAFKSILSGRKPQVPTLDPTDIDVPLVVKFTLVVNNEALGPLSFDKLGYELVVNGQRLVSGESTSITRDGGRCLITISNTFSSASLSKDVKALFTERKGTFAVTGTAALRVPPEIRKDPVPLGFKEGGAFTL